jgi:hypothetical protein
MFLWIRIRSAVHKDNLKCMFAKPSKILGPSRAVLILKRKKEILF